jgi:hypothetical protein
MWKDILAIGKQVLSLTSKTQQQRGDPATGRNVVSSAVVAYMLNVQQNDQVTSEWECLHTWAGSVSPADYAQVGVKGFGLAGFQYMRMLLGIQTTKPDVHIKRFVSGVIGRPVNSIVALSLLEQAAAQAGLPLREVDGAIWQAGARP